MHPGWSSDIAREHVLELRRAAATWRLAAQACRPRSLGKRLLPFPDRQRSCAERGDGLGRGDGA